jgi:hypothetical protein
VNADRAAAEGQRYAASSHCSLNNINGHVTITVVQKNGERFKTLAKNVVV